MTTYAIALGDLATGVEWVSQASGYISLGTNRQVYVYLRNADGSQGSEASVFSDAGLSVPMSQPLTAGAQSGALPGYVASGQSLLFVDVLTSATAQAEALAAAASTGASVTSPDGTISVTSGAAIDVVYGDGANTAAEGNDSRIVGALQLTGVLTDGNLLQSNGTDAEDSGLVSSSVVIAISTAGHPTTGTWLTGQGVIDSNGVVWYCTAGGTPGTWVEGGGGAVSSVFGRTGTVVATSGDYSVAQVTGGSTYEPVSIHGADPTGAADSTTAINAAIATGRQVLLDVPVGHATATYKIGTSADLTTFGRNQGMVGPGSQLVTLNYVGNGIGVHAYDSSFSSSLSNGGRFGGFAIQGSSAGSAAIGMEVGNLNTIRADDITIADFAGATAIGLNLKNASGAWSEQGRWSRIRLISNQNGVVFDTSSFDYSKFDFHFFCASGQNALTIQNGANLVGCELSIVGNITGGTGNTAWVIGIDPKGAGTGTSSFIQGRIFVNVECDGTSGTGHYSVLMDGNSSNCQFSAEGVLYFTDGGSLNFAGITITSGLFGFVGTVSDPTLGYTDGNSPFVLTGSLNFAANGNTSSNYAYSGMDIYLQGGDITGLILPSGAGSIAGVNGEPFKHGKRIDVFLKQPSGGGATMTFPANWKFAGGSKTLSTAGNAIDHVRAVYLPGDATWYCELVKAYA